MDIKRKKRRGLQAWVSWWIEKILAASGGITAFIILLIVVFLFKEGVGLFQSPRVDEGYVLLMHS